MSEIWERSTSVLTESLEARVAQSPHRCGVLSEALVHMVQMAVTSKEDTRDRGKGIGLPGKGHHRLVGKATKPSKVHAERD